MKQRTTGTYKGSVRELGSFALEYGQGLSNPLALELFQKPGVLEALPGFAISGYIEPL